MLLNMFPSNLAKHRAQITDPLYEDLRAILVQLARIDRSERFVQEMKRVRQAQ